ncbi:ABC transporter substrate-binding protein [Streptomyces thermocarboxydus]
MDKAYSGVRAPAGATHSLPKTVSDTVNGTPPTTRCRAASLRRVDRSPLPAPLQEHCMRTTRTTTLALAGLLIAATATGCGSAVTTSSAGTKANDFYAQIAGLPKDQQVAKAEEVARQEGNTLSLYTSMTSDVATPVTQAFEKKYGIKVNVFRGTSETVLQRTLQEVQAGKAGADALETNFAELMALADNKFLADFNGAALDKVDSTAKFPQWTATRLNVFQPAWNTDLIKPADEPHSWEDLALPKYKGN